MAEARVRRTHSLGLEVARERAEKAAGELGERYGARYEWKGNQIHFKRGPFKGYINVADTEVEFYANLGFLGGPLKGKVEGRARQILEEYFG